MEQANDEVYRQAMLAEAARLEKQIPSDHFHVHVTKTVDGNGNTILEFEAGGVQLSWTDVTVYGTAYAIREGESEPFEEITIASIYAADLAGIQAEQARKKPE